MQSNDTLVLEGGALRGLYTSGVLDAFMEEDLYIPQVVGVSAGALNALSYLSRQPGRSRRAVLDFIDDPRYMGTSHLLEKFSFFNFDFLLGEVFETLLPFDYVAFHSSRQRLWAVTTDCRTGGALLFEKADLGPDFFTAVRASSSLPLLAPMVRVGRDVCLDGGVACPAPLPAQLPFATGRPELVLTHEKGYRKEDESSTTCRLYQRRYERCPQLLEACITQPQRYNAQMDEIDRLESEGEVFVIRPSQPMEVSRTERSAEKLQALYEQGCADGKALLPALLEYLGEGDANLLRHA